MKKDVVTFEDAEEATEELLWFANNHNLNRRHYESLTSHIYRIQKLLKKLTRIEKLQLQV